MKKVVAYWLAAVLALSFMFFPVLPEQSAVHAQQAAPELRRFGPETVAAGAPQFTIRLEGRNFVQGANVLLDGVALPSPRVSGKKGRVLMAEVPPALVAAPGTHTIQAINPDNQTSATMTFNVVEQDPDLMIRLPLNSVPEDLNLIFLPEIRGEGFEEGLKVFAWRALNTTIISDTKLEVEITEGLTQEPARIPITVRDKRGNYSNTEIFFVVPRAPQIDFLNPDTVEVGTEDFLLRVHGDFKEGSVIVLNGQSLPTDQRSSDGRLEAMVPASFIANAAQLIVRVEHEGIQSQDEILTVTPTDDPFVYAIAPSRVRIGEDRANIDVVGANFQGDIVALIDGQETRIRDSSRRFLKVAVPDELLAAPGVHTIEVRNEDGVTTQPVTFEVVPDVTVSTLAGRSREGFNTEQCASGDDVLLRRPRRITLAADGLLYFTDQQNHVIRTVNPDTGEVCTIAGTGLEGYKDTGNPMGDPPVFSYPNGVAVASDGTIYVTENGNSVIRRISRTGSNITVETFAGTFSEITDRDRQRRLNSTRIGLEGFRSDEPIGSSFRLPDDILIAGDGTIYVADASNHSIRRIRNGVVETIAGNGVAGFADGLADKARFDTPTGLVLSDDGQFLFVADTNNNRIRIVDLLNNAVSTLAGSGGSGVDDGPAGVATFRQPIGLALDVDGVLYVSEVGGNDIRRVDAQGTVNTLAGDGTSKFRDGAGVRARFNAPRGLAIDRQRGILYVADYENSRIREVTLR